MADEPTSSQLPVVATPTPVMPSAVPITQGDKPAPMRDPVQQLRDLPLPDLHSLAEKYGVAFDRETTPQDLVSRIHDRRRLIASLDRDALFDVVRWGRRQVPVGATREQLSMEIVQVKSMRFSGLSHRGLVALARLRGLDADDSLPTPTVIALLKKQEGFFAKLNRKRRAFVGKMVGNMIGDSMAQSPAAGPADAAAPVETAQRALRHEIEESGLFGGIANRVKRSADQYINQKLDEIEGRLDRKLDEIDRRLGDWRDKEIANRIRILKITLWASVIVAAISILYSYMRLRLHWFG